MWYEWPLSIATSPMTLRYIARNVQSNVAHVHSQDARLMMLWKMSRHERNV